MRSTAIAMVLVSVIVSTLPDRAAHADEPSPADDRRVTPLVPAAATAPLRCECAPVSDSVWHWTERRKVGLAVIGFGVLSGAVGFGFAWSAHRMFEANDFRSGQQAAAIQNQQIRERNLVAGAYFGVAGLSALTGAALFLWPESKHVTITVLPNGGALVACGGAI
jgi:hypothetical protein